MQNVTNRTVISVYLYKNARSVDKNYLNYIINNIKKIIFSSCFCFILFTVLKQKKTINIDLIYYFCIISQNIYSILTVKNKFFLIFFRAEEKI